jgi:DNA-directed RNA polymerase subunit RPC12/RpoP
MPAITLHDVATNGHLIGIVCEQCMHHALLGAAKDRAKVGDRRSLQEGGVHCGKCGSRRFTATRFTTRAAAYSFMRNL